MIWFFASFFLLVDQKIIGFISSKDNYDLVVFYTISLSWYDTTDGSHERLITIWGSFWKSATLYHCVLISLFFGYEVLFLNDNGVISWNTVPLFPILILLQKSVFMHYLIWPQLNFGGYKTFVSTINDLKPHDCLLLVSNCMFW